MAVASDYNSFSVWQAGDNYCKRTNFRGHKNLWVLMLLQTPFLLKENHTVFYYFWIAIYIYILQLMVIRATLEALHLYYCFTHLAYLFVSNLTTTDATDSIPLRGKALEVLLFLDSSRLPLTLTRTALRALHYCTFVLFFVDVCLHSRRTFSLATGQLQTL